MKVDLVVTGVAEGVPPELAYQWWTDYGPHDHDGPAFRLAGWKKREVLERDKDGRVVRFRDPGGWIGLDHTYESTLEYDPPHRVVEKSEGPIGPFEAEYRFEDDEAGGTRIVWTIHGEVRPRWAKLLAWVPGVPELLARYDLDAHLLEMEAEIGKKED